MVEENINKLKVSISEDLRKRGDEPFVAYGGKLFTGNQLADEVENETEVGINIISGIVRLSIDLVQRGKEKLPE